MMHRLDRKIRILRGKRNGAFDSDQYFLERALRSRAARKVRLALRRMQPVLLSTPRWSEAQPFLDDISVDLRLGRPSLVARTLSLKPMSDRPVNHAWRFLLQGLIEFCNLQGEQTGTAVVDRNGFRLRLREVLMNVRTGPRRALLIHNTEYLHREAREDFLEAFGEYRQAMGDNQRLNVLIASTIGSAVDVPDACRVTLSDYSSLEAVEALVEVLGPTDKIRLDEAVNVVGGVPALLTALGSDGAANGTLAHGRNAIWRALGPLADEVRGALEIVASDDRLAQRLELVSEEGAVCRDEDAGDIELLRAGLIKNVGWGRPNRVAVRAPVFAELALAG